MSENQNFRRPRANRFVAIVGATVATVWVSSVIFLGFKVLEKPDLLTFAGFILLALGPLSFLIPTVIQSIKEARNSKRIAKMAPTLVLKEMLAAAGWFPGRRTDAEVGKLDFPMHAHGIEFMTEFGGLFLGNVIHVTARDANNSYKYRNRISVAHLSNCLPVAMSWYWCEGELWMDDLGRIYQADDNQLALVADKVEDALEILLVRRKEIPADFPKWEIEARESAKSAD